MHPRGISKLRDLGRAEKQSADVEDFATAMQMLHEQVKGKLQDSSQKCKQKTDLKRREVHFEVGDLVLAHLRKKIFPRNEYNKLKLKKIGPSKILRKFSANTYEIELPPDIGISPIFNVADLYPYKEPEAEMRMIRSRLNGRTSYLQQNNCRWRRSLTRKLSRKPEDKITMSIQQSGKKFQMKM